jgi:hypothetical protein
MLSNEKGSQRGRQRAVAKSGISHSTLQQPNRNVELVKRAADMVDVASGYTKLKKSGDEFVGLCPLHSEKTPSFYVHPVKQVYYCHGCQASGDVLGFIMAAERIDFPAALNLLAERFHVAISMARSLTNEEKRSWAEQQQERELIEHFRLIEGVSPGQAGREFHARCEADPGYPDWLKDDLAHAHAVCGLIVAVIAVAQEDNDKKTLEQAA